MRAHGGLAAPSCGESNIEHGGSSSNPESSKLPGWPQITPDWEHLTKHIEEDVETKDKLGWVREMYAWSIGAALQVRRCWPLTQRGL